jgi:hypothetical protein
MNALLLTSRPGSTPGFFISGYPNHDRQGVDNQKVDNPQWNTLSPGSLINSSISLAACHPVRIYGPQIISGFCKSALNETDAEPTYVSKSSGS